MFTTSAVDQMPCPEELEPWGCSAWATVSLCPAEAFFIENLYLPDDDQGDSGSRMHVFPTGILEIGNIARRNVQDVASVQCARYNRETVRWELLPVEEIWHSPGSAGGPLDTLFRIRGDVLRDSLGRPVAVGDAVNITLVYRDDPVVPA